jgi:MFS family permease
MSAPSPSCPDDAAARRLARSMAVVSAFCLTGDTMLYIALPLFWQECGLTALWQVGVLLAVNRLVRLPLNPLVRLLYTRIDQRTGMALAVVLAASTTLLYGVAQSFALWLLLRCLWGLAWTLLRLGSLFALMAASRKDNRGYLMGSYNGLVRLGSLLGFAEMLREATSLPVTLWDERRTTVDAHNILLNNGKRAKERKKTVDAVAASLMLEGYLTFKKRQG